jgi:hypothetical protein
MHMGSNERGAYYDKTGKGQRYLSDAVVDEQKNWPTPKTSMDDTPSDRRRKTPNLHCVVNTCGLPALANPSTDGSRPESWRTPTSYDWKNTDCSTQVHLSDQVEGRTEKQWATPIMGDSHLASTPEVAQKRIEEGKVTLSRQNPGKLNPRWVETLMGLPVGWVMPSCVSPVTIAPTSCDCLETESSQPPQNEHLELF